MKFRGETESLKRRLAEAEENLRLVRGRKSEYVQQTDIPLQLIKDERWLEQEIEALRAQLPKQRVLVKGSGMIPWKKQWAVIVAGVVVLMVSFAIIFTLRNSLDTNHPPSIQSIIASPSTLIVGQEAVLTVIATDVDGDNLVYYWEAQKGTVPTGAQGDTITYTASASSGLDTIEVTVSDGNASVAQEIKLSVLAADALGQ